MLCVFNLWKVKTLQFQLTTNQKKRKLGENLYTEEADEDEPCQQNMETYLDRLYTLLLAYAIAGVLPPQGRWGGCCQRGYWGQIPLNFHRFRWTFA